MKLPLGKLLWFYSAQIGSGRAMLLCTFPLVLLLNADPLYSQTVNPAVNAGRVNVCPAGKTNPAPCIVDSPVTFSIPAGTTIGSVAVLTTGVAGLDFKSKVNDTSTTLCKAKTYSTATNCTVDVTFGPLAPGSRKGAVELLDGNGDLIETTYIYGTGVGPQIVYSPPTLKTLAPQVRGSVPSMAVDANGNIFADIRCDTCPSSSGSVQEFFAADRYTSSKTLYSGELGSVIALDGAGNIFTVGGATTIFELVAAQGYALKTIKVDATQVLSGVLTVDGNDNLFVTVSDPHVKIQELLAATDYSAVETVGNSFHEVTALAVDAVGNVFLSDLDHEGPGQYVFILEEVLAADGYTTVKTLLSNSTYAALLGIDADDNLYFAELNEDYYGIAEAAAASGYTNVQVVHPGSYPFSIYTAVLDGSGNIYTSPNMLPGDITQFSLLGRSHPPNFAFANTGVGDVSSPHSATLQNIGNAILTGSLSLTDPTDFALGARNGEPDDCADTLSLAPGIECTLSVAFTPQSLGPLTASFALTDNVASGTESISLSGTGVASVTEVSPSTLQFGSIPLGGNASQTLTISNVGAGTLTVNPSSNGPSTVITGSTCGAGIAAGKSCALQVEFKPVRLGPDHNTVTISTSAGFSPKVLALGTATGVGSVSTMLDFGTIHENGGYTQTFTVTNYGVSGNVTVATSTGAISFKVVFNNCTSGITAGNSCSIGVQYDPATPGTQTAYLKLIPSTGPTQEIKMTGTMAAP